LRLVRSLPWNVEATDYYADIRHQLMSAGQPIGELDMMIAAHFAPLTLVNWVVTD
jgi:tRNA(fMet)-specific endonuclease VapC